MYRKRKGFTLSEVIVYLGITSLILAIPTSFKIVKDRGYELKVEGEISKIHDFLIEAKQLSKKDNLSGKIIFDIAENKLRYQNKVRSTSLKLNEVKISNNLKNVIEITQMGMLNRSGTITITDKNKKRREITITTGLKKINVK
ncbi:MAG: prepilin-type N-terminal cleavage/methylation domain-containing protein [Clostridium perfringens]|nr:prepilin-type N-terminal cleavage/methylation domain-containing protein [Clostridium perfringens]MDU6173884.1 prepilin-type N-terminal cleavage/methylation domain-containing protein [Clostridium perfringens]